MNEQAANTIQILWVALGTLIVSNFGVFVKIYFDNRKEAKLKSEAQEKEKILSQNEITQSLIKAIQENTTALKHFESDLQRVFTAVKLVAGKKWVQISKIIQEEHPRGK